MNAETFVVGSIGSLAVAVAYALFIPGIERKVHARIQQRVGPPISTPGLWNILKFSYKRRVKPHSPNPGVYHLLVVFMLAVVAATLLVSTPTWWGILGFSTLLGLAGLLKLEEVSYVVMGFFSRSVMSVGMPWADLATYAGFRDAPRKHFEEVGAMRALKMITLGSFPFYAALSLPFIVAGSLDLSDVVALEEPVILSLSGLLSAFVYFIGYNMLTNNRPFDIIKPKVDVIEGPLMEYAAIWRGIYYLSSALLSFTLSSVFVALYLGIPFDVTATGSLPAHLALVALLPVSSAVLRAFSPVFTFKQVYSVSLSATILGFTAIVLAMTGI